jgi:hypothetical protein
MLEVLTDQFPQAVARGELPRRLEIRASGTIRMADAMSLIRDVAQAAESDLKIVLQVDGGASSPEMAFVRWDGKSKLPTIRVTALQNEMSGEYVLVSDGDRDARVLRSLVTERAVRAIAALIPGAMLAKDRAVLISAESGAALTLREGATLFAALRHPGRTLRVTGIVEGLQSPSQD